MGVTLWSTFTVCELKNGPVESSWIYPATKWVDFQFGVPLLCLIGRESHWSSRDSDKTLSICDQTRESSVSAATASQLGYRMLEIFDIQLFFDGSIDR